jgi:hypothetical protein
MKYLVFILTVLLFVSCNSEKTESNSEERAIGFNTFLPDLKWHLGTEDAITIVKKLDSVWAKRDYEAMRIFLADTAKFYFPDGKVAKSPSEFINTLKEDDADTTNEWTFDYAYSVDLDPTRGGEHVQAGFTGTSVKDSVTTKKNYHESYYIIDGKIVMWTQNTRIINEE